MKNNAFTCKPLEINNPVSDELISLSDLNSSEPSPRLGVGVPVVRNKDGVVVWKPDAATCRFWSIRGGGTVAAIDKQGRLIEVYRLRSGESVETKIN